MIRILLFLFYLFGESYEIPNKKKVKPLSYFEELLGKRIKHSKHVPYNDFV